MKVVVVDVDLGLDIRSIFADEVQGLTGPAVAALDQALATARANQEARQERERAAQAVTDALTALLEEVLTDLKQAGDVGLAVSTVLSKVAHLVSTPSAFTLRFKNFLSQRGNPYRLERIKHLGTPHYALRPYNETLPATPAQETS